MNLSMDPQLHKKNNIYFLSVKTISILPLLLSCQPEIQSDSLFGFNPSGVVLRSLSPMLCQRIGAGLSGFLDLVHIGYC